MTKYAYVAIPVPLDELFVYCFEDESVVPGVRVIVDFKGHKHQAYVIKTTEEKPDVNFTIKKIVRVVDSSPLFDFSQYELALWMEKFYFSHRGEILDTMIPGGKKDVGLAGLDADMAENRRDVELTPQQKNAVDKVINSNDRLFYIYGITGSGKTEVFLNCAERIIKSGGQVIYLVPEITLTHQLAMQVLKRFENNVAILHSLLTDSQRIAQWRKIKNGEVSLVIGARSAVFAPFSNLKMIIIDEEHESSYKSSNNPRYHARQVAQKRISDCNGKLLMGSATPSLESWFLMKDSSKMTRIDLDKRVGGGAVPTVTIANMSKEKGMFSQILISRMHDALSRGKQIILFLNRRGYSYYFHCVSCGYELKCPHCDVAMTYHRSTGELVCHYCGYRQKPLKVCPECGSLDVLYSGFGTEQVEEEIKRLFPESNVARLDTDTVSSNRKIVQKTLDEFKKGKINILLGTQMVAKGLNFPNVELVGIIMADSGLLIPDFRAEERTFDLLVQVSGRSGRADNNGQVVVQTRMPAHPAITMASKAEVSSFLDRELEVRKQTNFPPFSRMISIVARSKTRALAMETTSFIADALRALGQKIEVYGSQECPIEKVREYYRYMVVIKSSNAALMMKCVKTVLSSYKVNPKVVLETDVDPLDML